MTIEANAELDRVFGGQDGPSPIRFAETRIRPAPAWNSAAELARRDDPVGFVQGVQAGHQDALALLEPQLRDLWSDLNIYRSLRDRSHREHADFRVYGALVKNLRPVLCNALSIRRALKAGVR